MSKPEMQNYNSKPKIAANRQPGTLSQRSRLTVGCRRGFTLLMSVLVTAIILSVGMGIMEVIIRETKISGLGRESQIAFSAADAGVECAFFWEIKHPGMAQSAFNTANTIGCAGNSVSNNFSGGISSFSVNLGNSSCVSVKVDKTPPSQTIIESRGYNTDCGSISPFKVERAIRLTLNKIKSDTLTFNYTGDVQTFTVPPNITKLIITAYGAQGGGTGGGLGGMATGKFSVITGETLYIYVGGRPGPYDRSGGGASDVRRGGTTLYDRIIVGGGGGGEGFENSVHPGGAGGGLVGGNGSGDYPGQGGSQTAGGGGGGGNQPGSSGTLGIGGNASQFQSGGGGGGYYGGGGGGNSLDGGDQASGGGGGSGYIDSQAADASTQSGVNSGAGRVIISY